MVVVSNDSPVNGDRVICEPRRAWLAVVRDFENDRMPMSPSKPYDCAD